MRVVVLHADFRRLRPAVRVAGREVIRVQVVRDDRGPHAEKALHAPDGVFVGFERLEILEIADVRAQVCRAAGAEAERVLQQRPAREHGLGEAPVCGDAARDVAPRAAQHHRRARDHAGHRVVAARVDVAVVQEKPIGHAGEPRDGLLVPIRKRFIREVPGCHDERPADNIEQQVMQRGVRQQEADQRVAGRHAVRDGRRCPPPREHDGPFH